MKILQAFLLLMVFAGFASADISIVVHPSSEIAAVEAEQLKRLYLGKSSSIGSDDLTAIDQVSSEIKKDFLSVIVNKTESQYKSYWSKLIFTGKGKPPRELGSDAEVIAFVSATPNSIGFVSSASVNASVKVVAEFQ